MSLNSALKMQLNLECGEGRRKSISNVCVGGGGGGGLHEKIGNE